MQCVIQDIINSQLQNLKRYNSNELYKLGNEDFLISIKNGIFDIQSNQEPNFGQKVRLDLILPYIANFCQSYKILDLKFILSVGDCLDTVYNIDIPVLCLSKKKHLNGLLIPNIDFFTGAINTHLKISDNDIEYHQKLNKSIFIGSSTGNFNSNTRLLFSEKCLNNDNHFSYINNLCQNTKESWLEKYPFIDKVMHDEILIQEQLNFKLTINIDGNTSCWSRLYWQMNSNSLPVYIDKQQSDIQFFDIIEPVNCYVSCSLEDSIEVLDTLLKNSQEKIQNIIDNGKLYCYTMFYKYRKNPYLFLQTTINELLIGHLST
jgi:hypothetical protein